LKENEKADTLEQLEAILEEWQNTQSVNELIDTD
jgi:hypothetical protein